MSQSYTVALAGGANVAMTTEELVSAFNVGMIKEETLIWREGVDEWAPLAEFASELGVSVKGAVPVTHLRSEAPAESVSEPVRPQDAAISFRPRRVATEREKAEALAREAHLKRAKECEACGHVGRPFKVPRGSSDLEIVLWLCFLVPGAIYSAWRRKGDEACAKCGHRKLIPLAVDGPAETVEQGM